MPSAGGASTEMAHEHRKIATTPSQLHTALPSPLQTLNQNDSDNGDVNIMAPPPPPVLPPPSARLLKHDRGAPAAVPSPASTPTESSVATILPPPSTPSSHDTTAESNDNDVNIHGAAGGGGSNPAKNMNSGNLEDDGDNRVRVLCRFRRCLDELDGAGVGGGGRRHSLGRSSSNGWLHFDDASITEDGGGLPETVSVRMGNAWSKRAFDRVFRPGADQNEVYDAVKLVAHGVAQGFNGTIFAYGQTGSGKTYTMGGGSDSTSLRLWSSSPSFPNPLPADTLGSGQYDTTGTEDSPGSGGDSGADSAPGCEAGVIPRAVSTVLADANARKEQGWEFVLTATYVEIYNERIRDLLDPTSDNLKVTEHPARGVEAAGALEVRVATLDEAVAVLTAGARHRMTAATMMNQASSRSHSIFTLRLDQRDVVRDCKVSGRLTLVDLAGSERAGKTGAEGRRLEEANSINVSLHTLGRVIRALSESAPHVPFRDSKLTRLLQESLGGNSRPEEAQAQETMSTLKFGECAKRVSTFASANVVAAPNEVAAQLSELRAEVVRLKRQLHDFQLREARRSEYTPSGTGRRSRRSSAGRAGFASPGGAAALSPTSTRALRNPSTAARALGGSGPLQQKKWSETSPLSRTVSFNESYTAGEIGGSSGEESWIDTTPREWEEDAIVTWSATAAATSAGEVSPFPAAQTPTRWRSTARRLEPPESLLVDDSGTPTVSPNTTPVASGIQKLRVERDRMNLRSGGAGDGVSDEAGEIRGAGGAVESPSGELSDNRRAWSDLGRSEQNQRQRQQQLQRRDEIAKESSSSVSCIEKRRSPPGRRSGSFRNTTRRGREMTDTGNDDDGFRWKERNDDSVMAVMEQESAAAPATAAASAAGLAAAATERSAQARDGRREVEDEDEDTLGSSDEREREETTEVEQLRARVENLERGWKERETLYEKLLQLKDLRIQSLTSIYQNGSSSFKEAVKAQKSKHSSLSPSSLPTAKSPTTKYDKHSAIAAARTTPSSLSERQKQNRCVTRTGSSGNLGHSPIHGGAETGGVRYELARSREIQGSGGFDGAKLSSRKKRVSAEGGGSGRPPTIGMFPVPPPAPPSSPLERDRAEDWDVMRERGATAPSRIDGAISSDEEADSWFD